jgi:hypothetical protein
MSAVQDQQEESDVQVSGPLVFSCLKCRSIVGDTFSLMSSNEEAKTITLSAASNIQRTNEIFTSYESLDEGSTYFEVLCRSCQQALGRYYVTTSKDLDHVREKFTFSIDSITSYELGKAQHGKIPDVTVVSFPVAEEVAAEGSNPMETVQEDVTKVSNGNAPLQLLVSKLVANPLCA